MDSSEVRKLAKRSQKEHLEISFLRHWNLLFPNLPPPVRQFKVLNPNTGRHWKLDFYWAECSPPLCVELNGGSWIAGGHNTAQGQHKDYIRHNTLTRMGIRCLYFNTIACQNMADVVQEVAEILCSAE